MTAYANRPPRTQKQIDGQKVIFDALWSFLETNARTPIPKGTCLEFGSGRFGYIDHYKAHFRKSYALDIYDFAECYGDDVDYLLSEDQLTIPLPEASVDMIVSHSVLEHVMDIRATIAEMDRVLKVGGLALLTVSPLYWSYCGGHLYTPDRRRLENWEHLDPQSDYFLEDRDEIKIDLGGFLNRLTVAQLLEAVGRVPWSIEKLDLRGDPRKTLPAHVMAYGQDGARSETGSETGSDARPGAASEVDYHIREFKLLIRKVYRVAGERLCVRDG